jgi:hypothetical protein
MASFSTVIKSYSESENVRSYSIAGHTVQKPRILKQKRRAPTSPTASAESELQVQYGTVDIVGSPLPGKIVFTANVRYPLDGLAADVTAALAVFRDFVASDQFTDMVNSQNYVKE